MDNTIIQQGLFQSTGQDIILNLRSDIDWLKVINLTVAAADQIAAIGCEYYWQRGMNPDTVVEYKKSNAANAANLIDFVGAGGCTLINTAYDTFPLHTDVTAVSNAAIPVVTATANHGLSAGVTVRLTDITGADQLGGMDFTVGYNTLGANTFSLDYMPQIVAGTVGNWQRVFSSIYYPRRRYITKVTNASNAVITLSVTHGFTVGQKIRVSIPAAFGMTLAPTQATILAINTTATTGNTITVDIDTTMLAPFVFPLTAAPAFTPAQVVPLGEDTGTALNSGVDILGDSTLNTAIMGILLAAGADSPAGQNGDTIAWVAGKSFSDANEL
jgi:hypothetical protein